MGADAAVAAVFEPVRTATTFEETVDRLGTAIRLGILAPGSRLPSERDLAEQLAISRSTLRQAITALVESGHLTSVRGRTGGTFVVPEPPLAEGSAGPLPEGWHEVLDVRIAVEVGVAAVAAERIDDDALAAMAEAGGGRGGGGGGRGGGAGRGGAPPGGGGGGGEGRPTGVGEVPPRRRPLPHRDRAGARRAAAGRARDGGAGGGDRAHRPHRPPAA